MKFAVGDDFSPDTIKCLQCDEPVPITMEHVTPSLSYVTTEGMLVFTVDTSEGSYTNLIAEGIGVSCASCSGILRVARQTSSDVDA